MYKASAFVFWTTLCLYLVTLFTVSYVGVYLTYAAVPVIVLSGVVMKLSNSQPKKPGAFGNAAKSLFNGLQVLAIAAEKLASDAEKATADLLAKAEEKRDAKAEEQEDAFSDKARGLRRAKLEKLRLRTKLQSDVITRDVFDAEISRIDKQIVEIEKSQSKSPSKG